MTKQGIDWGYGSISADAIKNAGYSFICRYLSFSKGKNISLREYQNAISEGLDVVLVWETTERRSLQGYEIGQSDAKTALKEAQDLGIQTPNCIYFACDDDFTLDECNKIAEYFRGVNSVLGVEHTGVYGGITPVRYMLDKELVKYGWQTYAWSHHEWDPRAQLRQIKNGTPILQGIQCDTDQAISEDFGQIDQTPSSNPSSLIAFWSKL